MRVESRMLDLLGEATSEVDWGERIAFHEKEIHRLQTQTPTASNAPERKASIAKHKAALMAAYSGRLPTKDEVAAAVDQLGEADTDMGKAIAGKKLLGRGKPMKGKVMNPENRAALEKLLWGWQTEAGAYRPHFGDPIPRGSRRPERDYFEAGLKQARLSLLIRKLVNSGDDDKVRAEALALCAEITDILK